MWTLIAGCIIGIVIYEVVDMFMCRAEERRGWMIRINEECF